MNVLLRIARVLTALALVVVASAHAAPPQKIYVLQADTGVANGKVNVRFKNISPDGNSTFNSLKLFVSGFTITGATVNVPFTGIVGAPQAGGTRIDVTSISPPVKPGDVIELAVDVTAACGAQGNWSASVYTGSSLNGQTFAPQPGSPNPPISFVENTITNAPAPVTFAFKTQPHDAYAGQLITTKDLNAPLPSDQVQVQFSRCNAALGVGNTVTLKAVDGTTEADLPLVTVNGNTATIAATGIATFSSLTIDTIGSYKLVATTPAAGDYAAQSATSDQFDIVANDASLACGATYAPGATPEGNNTTVKRETDKNKLDTDPCPPIGLNLTITDQGRKLHVQWDEQLYPNVVLRTTTEWPVEAVDDAATVPVETWPKRTKVAWFTDPQNPNDPVFIEAQLCVTSDLPKTTATPPLLTTLPILPAGVPSPYVAGEQARACIISERTDVQLGATCTLKGLTSPCVIVDTEMYFVGDPWLSRQ